HTIDNYDRIVSQFIECRNKARCILAIHHVNDEDDIRFFKILFDVEPLTIAQRRAEVVRRHTQVELVRTIDLALRVFERGQQTRADVENSDIHRQDLQDFSGLTRFFLYIMKNLVNPVSDYATPSSWSSRSRLISRNRSNTLSSISQYPRPFASNNLCARECAECGFRSRKRSSICSSNKNVFATSV